MDDRRDWWLLLPDAVRQLPADLAGVCLFLLGTIVAVFVPVLNETPVRVLFGLGFVLFVPGYALVAAIFPEARRSSENETGERTRTKPLDGAGIPGSERIALSITASIALVSLVGLVLVVTPWGVQLRPVIVAVSGMTLMLVVVAAHRRQQLPAEEQFRLSYGEWLVAGRKAVRQTDSKRDTALNVLLVVSVVLATVSVGYAVLLPKQGEAFTELYLLNEGEGGELVADGYPTNFTVGESKPVVVGIGNHEREQMDYTVVVQLQRVEQREDTIAVREQRELDRLQATVVANGTWQQRYDIQPTMSGQDLRLVFLLYREEPPEEPTMANAYRTNDLLVNATDGPG